MGPLDKNYKKKITILNLDNLNVYLFKFKDRVSSGKAKLNIRFEVKIVECTGTAKWYRKMVE